MAEPSASPDATRNELLSTRKLLVVGKSFCPYTQRARKALADIGAKFASIDLDLMRDGEALQARAQHARSAVRIAPLTRGFCFVEQSSFASVSGIKTVPQVFVDGACVGGCDDTLAALRDGSMQQRLAACGVMAGSS